MTRIGMGSAPTFAVGGRLDSGYYIGPMGARIAFAMAANVEYAVPIIVTQPGTLVTLGLEIVTAGTAGTVIRLGVRGDNGTSRPGSLLLDAGTLAADAITSGIEISGISLAVTSGLYWFTATAQNTGGTLPVPRGQTGDLWPVSGMNTILNALGSTPGTGYSTTATVPGALPASYTASNRSGFPPRVVAKCL